MVIAFNLYKVYHILLQKAGTSDLTPQHCVRELLSLPQTHFATPANQDRPQAVTNLQRKTRGTTAIENGSPQREMGYEMIGVRTQNEKALWLSPHYLKNQLVRERCNFISTNPTILSVNSESECPAHWPMQMLYVLPRSLENTAGL